MEIENTFTFASYNPTIRQANAEHIERDPECQQLINELRNIEKFLRDFGFFDIWPRLCVWDICILLP